MNRFFKFFSFCQQNPLKLFNSYLKGLCSSSNKWVKAVTYVEYLYNFCNISKVSSSTFLSFWGLSKYDIANRVTVNLSCFCFPFGYGLASGHNLDDWWVRSFYLGQWITCVALATLRLLVFLTTYQFTRRHAFHQI